MKFIRTTLYFFSLFILFSCSTENTPVYQLTASVNPTDAGSVSPAEGQYDEGSQVTLTATANENWAFDQWQGDASGSDNPHTFSMTGNKDITAFFVKQSYPLTISVEGEGTVQENVLQEKSTDYPHGTLVELTAQPAKGWRFAGWSGAIESTENPIQLTVEEATEIIATFERKDYTLTITTEGQGAVTEEVVQSKSTDYPHGTIVRLTAEGNTGWEFTGWSGDLSGEENPVEITITEETQITATFGKITYPLTVTIEGQGQVDERVVQTKSTGYEYGTLVELTAVPADGWALSGWSGDAEGQQNPITVQVNGATDVTATFLQTYTFSTTVKPAESGTITPEAGEYAQGNTLQVQAMPANNGWRFKGWTGALSGKENPASLTMDGDKSVTAYFERRFFDVEIPTEGEGSVDVTMVSGNKEGEKYGYESVIELLAKPGKGWVFMQWEEDEQSEYNPVQVTIDRDKTIRAVFGKFEAGDGTAANPYQVANLRQLNNVRNYPNAHFIQIADIDASDTENWNDGRGFVPIGDRDHPFTGSYDGREYEIASLYISSDGTELNALFGSLSETGVLENIRLKDIDIGLFYYPNGDITDGNSFYAGLVGINRGEINNVEIIGGRVGAEYCYSAAGIANENYGSINNGSVIAIVGVHAASVIGGLVGINFEDGSITNSEKRGLTTADYGDPGGIADENYGLIENTHNKGEVYGAWRAGSAYGIAEINGTTGKIIHSSSTGEIVGGFGKASGLVRLNEGLIEQSFSSGPVYVFSDENADVYLSGLAINNEGSIVLSYSDAILRSGRSDGFGFDALVFVGGLVLQNSGSISNSYFNGRAISLDCNNNHTIGLLVRNNSGTIENSFSAGQFDESFFTPSEDCDSFSAATDIYGFTYNNSGTVQGSYWDQALNDDNSIEAVGSGNTDGINGLNTSQMQGESAEDNMPGFDWNQIWETVSGDYPRLRWQ